jgi:hypothetical protein
MVFMLGPSTTEHENSFKLFPWEGKGRQATVVAARHPSKEGIFRTAFRAKKQRPRLTLISAGHCPHAGKKMLEP